MASTKRYWYYLVNSEGRRYGDIDFVVLSQPPFLVADFREAVKTRRPELQNVAAANLTVCAAAASTDDDVGVPQLQLEGVESVPDAALSSNSPLFVKYDIRGPAELFSLEFFMAVMQQTMQQAMQPLTEEIRRGFQLGFQQLQQQAEEDRQNLRETGSEITISGISETVLNWVQQEIGLDVVEVYWTSVAPTIEPIPNYTWSQDSEHSREQRKKYMEHLRALLGYPVGGRNGYDLKDCSSVTDLLDIPTAEEWLGNVRVKGTTDVVITKIKPDNPGGIKKHIAGQFELKKSIDVLPSGTPTGKQQAQAIIELLAASYLSSSLGVLTVLTDLGDSWYFYWLSSDTKRIHRLSVNRGLAKHLLDNMFATPDEARHFPEDFCTRGTWDSLKERVFCQKAQTNEELGNQDRDKGGGAGSDAGESKCRRTSDPGAGGGSTIGLSRSPGSDNKGRGGKGIGRKRPLEPGCGTDVANMLDLVDMEDEREAFGIWLHVLVGHMLSDMMRASNKDSTNILCDGDADDASVLNIKNVKRLDAMNRQGRFR